MRLARPDRAGGARISLVAMVDVLMIMLVFFMVTSTYLDLDMVPLAGGAASAGASRAEGGSGTLLVRIDAEGRAGVRGQVLDGAALGVFVAEERARRPGLEILLLPSGQADVQALATAMNALVGTGARRIRVVRLEAEP